MSVGLTAMPISSAISLARSGCDRPEKSMSVFSPVVLMPVTAIPLLRLVGARRGRCLHCAVSPGSAGGLGGLRTGASAENPPEDVALAASADADRPGRD